MSEEKFLVQELREGNKTAFTLIFRTYYKDLVYFAKNYLKDRELCEDIVQNIFLKIWNERQNLRIETSLRSFLIKSIQNACLDNIRHQQIVRNYADAREIEEMELGLIDPDKYMLYSDLNSRLAIELNKLPVAYKQAFELSKLEGLRHKEISEMLNISERTVEDRISKALTLLREYLKDFLITIIIILLN